METIYTSYVRSKSFFHFFLPSLSLSLSIFLILSRAESLSKREKAISIQWILLCIICTLSNERSTFVENYARIWGLERNSPTYLGRRVKYVRREDCEFAGIAIPWVFAVITRRGGFFASVKLEAGTKCCDNAILPAPVFVTRSILGSKPRIDRFCSKSKSLFRRFCAWKKLETQVL